MAAALVYRPGRRLTAHEPVSVYGARGARGRSAIYLKTPLPKKMRADVPTPPRDELRRRLRSKIRGSRQPPSPDLSRMFKHDPATALLNLGVEDPTLLRHARNLAENPRALLRAVRDAAQATETESDEEMPPGRHTTSAHHQQACDAEDDEELPPGGGGEKSPAHQTAANVYCTHRSA